MGLTGDLGSNRRVFSALDKAASTYEHTSLQEFITLSVHFIRNTLVARRKATINATTADRSPGKTPVKKKRAGSYRTKMHAILVTN